MKLGRRFGAAALLLVSACVSVPPQPIDPAESARRLAARSLSDPRVADALAKSGLGGQGEWSLDSLTVAAWTLRADIAVASADVAAGDAAERTAGELPNPTLSIDPGRLYDNANHNVSPWTVAAAIGFTIETGDKREIRVAQAHAEAEARRWQLAEALWKARQDVRKALIARELANANLALAHHDLDLRQSYDRFIENEIKFGAGSLSDRLTSQQSLAQAQAQLRTATAEAATAEADLSAALGVGTAQGIKIAPLPLTNLPDPAANDPMRLRDLGMIDRLSVRHSLADYLVSEQALRQAVAKQYPDINLGGGHTYDKGDRGFTLNLGLTLPLFHNADAAIAEAVAARRKAAATFEAAQAGALADIDVSTARYRGAYTALIEARAVETAAVKLEAAAKKQIDLGGADRGQMLTAQIATATSRRATFDALKLALDALAAMEDGVQRPIWPHSDLAVEHPETRS